MKTAICILISVVTCMAQDDQAIVRFSNGDQLTGEILSLTGEKLSWKSQILREPAEFELEHVLDLSIPSAIPASKIPAAGHRATLEMTNGDSIVGQLAGVSDEEIRLQTWYAGELVMRRVNVKSVKISPTPDYHYRGPNSIGEWTRADGDGDWTFKNGELHSELPGGIAREVDFPDECSIAFDVAWRGSLRTKLVFFSNDITTSGPESGYEMVFQRNSVQLRKCGTNNLLGHTAGAGELRENEKARIEVKASRKSGKIALFIDGEIVDAWDDKDMEKAALGKGLHFVAEDNSPLRISGIEVTSWDGYLEELPDRQARLQRAIQLQNGVQLQLQGRFNGIIEMGDRGAERKPEEEKLPEGRMILRNGDSLEGEVLGISGDEITIKTPFSEVKFPVARLKNIALSPAELETPKRYKGDIRATLADGSKLVFRLDSVEDGELLGFSQNFGNARFTKDTVKRIEFNIHKTEYDALRNRKDW